MIEVSLEVSFHSLSTSAGNLAREGASEKNLEDRINKDLMTPANSVSLHFPLEASRVLWGEDLGTQLVWRTFLEISPSLPSLNPLGQIMCHVEISLLSLCRVKTGFASELSQRLLVLLCAALLSVVWGMWRNSCAFWVPVLNP